MSSITHTLRASRMQSYPSLRRTCPPGTRISSVRRSQYHRTSALGYPYKDDQSKDSLKPRSTEYSKSGSDDAAAAQDEAFDPSKTKPEEQKASAGGASEHQKGDENPLEVSPANPKSSQPRDPQEGGATKAPQQDRERTSKAGGAQKAGGGKSS